MLLKSITVTPKYMCITLLQKFIRTQGSNLFDYQVTDVLFCASLFISMQDIQHRVFLGGGRKNKSK